MTPHLSANPRFYDRLLAVCSALLGAALLFLAVQALQPPLGPQPGEPTTPAVQVRGVVEQAPAGSSPEVASSPEAREPAS